MFAVNSNCRVAMLLSYRPARALANVVRHVAHESFFVLAGESGQSVSFAFAGMFLKRT